MIGTLREDTVVQPFSSMDFYAFGKTLGQGAYGKVKLGSHLLTGEKVAVKTFEKSKLTEAHARKRVSREIRILKALNHPYIIKLYEVVDVPLRKFLIMQYSSGGDLCRYVRSSPKIFRSFFPFRETSSFRSQLLTLEPAFRPSVICPLTGRIGVYRSRSRAGFSARLWRGCTTATSRGLFTAT